LNACRDQPFYCMRLQPTQGAQCCRSGRGAARVGFSGKYILLSIYTSRSASFSSFSYIRVLDSLANMVQRNGCVGCLSKRIARWCYFVSIAVSAAGLVIMMLRTPVLAHETLEQKRTSAAVPARRSYAKEIGYKCKLSWLVHAIDVHVLRSCNITQRKVGALSITNS
jgi:hypothetical protein